MKLGECKLWPSGSARGSAVSTKNSVDVDAQIYVGREQIVVAGQGSRINTGWGEGPLNGRIIADISYGNSSLGVSAEGSVSQLPARLSMAVRPRNVAWLLSSELYANGSVTSESAHGVVSFGDSSVVVSAEGRSGIGSSSSSSSSSSPSVWPLVGSARLTPTSVAWLVPMSAAGSLDVSSSSGVLPSIALSADVSYGNSSLGVSAEGSVSQLPARLSMAVRPRNVAWLLSSELYANGSVTSESAHGVVSFGDSSVVVSAEGRSGIGSSSSSSSSSSRSVWPLVGSARLTPTSVAWLVPMSAAGSLDVSSSSGVLPSIALSADVSYGNSSLGVSAEGSVSQLPARLSMAVRPRNVAWLLSSELYANGSVTSESAHGVVSFGDSSVVVSAEGRSGIGSSSSSSSSSSSRSVWPLVGSARLTPTSVAWLVPMSAAGSLDVSSSSGVLPSIALSADVSYGNSSLGVSAEGSVSQLPARLSMAVRPRNVAWLLSSELYANGSVTSESAHGVVSFGDSSVVVSAEGRSGIGSSSSSSSSSSSRSVWPLVGSARLTPTSVAWLVPMSAAGSLDVSSSSGVLPSIALSADVSYGNSSLGVSAEGSVSQLPARLSMAVRPRNVAWLLSSELYANGSVTSESAHGVVSFGDSSVVVSAEGRSGIGSSSSSSSSSSRSVWPLVGSARLTPTSVAWLVPMSAAGSLDVSSSSGVLPSIALSADVSYGNSSLGVSAEGSVSQLPARLSMAVRPRNVAWLLSSELYANGSVTSESAHGVVSFGDSSVVVSAEGRSGIGSSSSSSSSSSSRACGLWSARLA